MNATRLNELAIEQNLFEGKPLIEWERECESIVLYQRFKPALRWSKNSIHPSMPKWVDDALCDWLDFRREQIEADSVARSVNVPDWNVDKLTLTYMGKTAKRIKNRSQAKNVMRVLQAFQKAGWPSRIDDPLPHPASAERTNKTVASLNRGLSPVLRFSADGSGLGFCWKAAD